jgi:hypothetical protein
MARQLLERRSMVSHSVAVRAQRGGRPNSKLRLGRLLHENGLSLVFFGLFVLTACGQVWAGFADFNEELIDHGRAAVALSHYLTTGHFLEAIFENWESEFLQMALFVVLTVWLRQKGSSESKALEQKPAEVDEDPRKHRKDSGAPWPVRRGGLWLRVYEHSLTLALAALFLISFVLHGVFGMAKSNQERLLHHEAAQRFLEYVASSRFWYESFQNWQSEFLSVFSIIVLSIFLRQRGSSQSKPVAAAHAETGESD